MEWTDSAAPQKRALYEYSEVIWKHRRLVGGLALAGAVLAGAVTLFLPKEYEATASVMAPAERPAAILGGLNGTGDYPAASLPWSGGGAKDSLLGILKSRSMLDDVVRQFDLARVYGLTGSKAPVTDARARLQGRTSIGASREGVISVTVAARDPQLAADLANFYVDNLYRLNTALNVTEAGRTRRFLEARVAESERRLREAEDRLRAFQTQTRAVVLDGQAKAAIEGMARLEGQILAAEVQLKTVQAYATDRHPDVLNLRDGIAEMRRQLRRLEYGRESSGAARGGPASDFAMPLGMLPETGAEMARLAREAKSQEMIHGLLVQQLEQARVAEAGDSSALRILDRAVPPERAAGPSVAGNAMIAALLSFALGAGVAFVRESRAAAR